jgi:hypothetical protein
VADYLVALDGDKRDRKPPGATQGINEPGLSSGRKRRRMNCANGFDVRRRFSPNLHHGTRLYTHPAA